MWDHYTEFTFVIYVFFSKLYPLMPLKSDGWLEDRHGRDTQYILGFRSRYILVLRSTHCIYRCTPITCILLTRFFNLGSRALQRYLRGSDIWNSSCFFTQERILLWQRVCGGKPHGHLARRATSLSRHVVATMMRSLLSFLSLSAVLFTASAYGEQIDNCVFRRDDPYQAMCWSKHFWVHLTDSTRALYTRSPVVCPSWPWCRFAYVKASYLFAGFWN